MINSEYEKLINSKRHLAQDFGIKPIWYPDNIYEGNHYKLLDHQRYTADYAIRKGRCANFLDTGLGKTIVNLVIAYNYAMATKKRVLIITPLAVAFQFIDEAQKFGIDDIKYSKDGKLESKIVICNYERLHLFNHSDFETVILDESSILKNDKGKIRIAVTAFLRKIKYRFMFTATPSPNDFFELGTSSEALGYLDYSEMLKQFFTNNEKVIKAKNIHDKFMLMPHAKKSFFEWVSTWSISMRKPSDFGFSDEGYILPELITKVHKVKNNQNWIIDGQIMLFNPQARRMGEVREEQRQTVKERCEEAVRVAANHECSVYWTNINKEADLINELDKNSYQINGTMDLDEKEDILYNFAKGNIKKLITKPRISSFGLNWQHCNHSVTFPTFSYEQRYQTIRRLYRFGQKRKVYDDLVTSYGQDVVIKALEAKEKKANELFTELNSSINENFKAKKVSEFDKEIKLPSFLRRN